MKRRCPQCYERRATRFFVGKQGQPTKNCSICRKKYAGWDALRFDEKLALTVARRDLPERGALRVLFVASSNAKKLAGLPASLTTASTCPPTCSFYGRGCYAEFHSLKFHWSKVGDVGLTWRAFCEKVAALPPGQPWRHNIAGDLPGQGTALDAGKLGALARASAHARGFTFTHKPLETAADVRAVLSANTPGFTINLSADGIEDADRLARLGIAPVAAVVPSDAPAGLTTPAGQKLVYCLYDEKGMPCSECRLCAVPGRKGVVAFRAHGQYQQLVSEIVREKR